MSDTTIGEVDLLGQLAQSDQTEPLRRDRRAVAPDTVPVIELEHVGKTYPGGVHALHDVNLAIHPGDLVGIVGPSGSGKSTLLHLMGTLDHPTTGTVRVLGHNVGELRDRPLSAVRASWIGFVFQQFHLSEYLSAVDNVATGLLYGGVGRRERRTRAVEALERVGLGHRLGHRPSAMSGGERQRTAIARALVGRPAIVLADEPTGNLDSASGDSVLRLLRELNEEGATIAVITHDASVAERCPRRIRIADGVVEG